VLVRISILATFLFLLHAHGNGQMRRAHAAKPILKDSTKMPDSLIDFRFYNTKDSTRRMLEFTFLTKERPDAIYKGHKLDSIHLYSSTESTSFIRPIKDTLCFDSSNTVFCKWINTFEVDQRQYQFLSNGKIDRITFIYDKGYQDKIYLIETDKKLLQNKFKWPD
jgi:hypothetical protein